jgi:hypothetical protein
MLCFRPDCSGCRPDRVIASLTLGSADSDPGGLTAIAGGTKVESVAQTKPCYYYYY